jgi:hypothetical protein
MYPSLAAAMMQPCSIFLGRASAPQRTAAHGRRSWLPEGEKGLEKGPEKGPEWYCAAECEQTVEVV